MIKFHILGTTTLQKEDRSFDQSFLKGPKRVALLCYLLIARPRGFHRRDELVALFWPKMGQKAARNALSNMLYQIREVLRKEALINRGVEEISIDPEKIWCDAVAFDEALDENAAEKALDLYQGDLLPAFHVSEISNEFNSWLDRERERLRKRAFKAAGKLAEQAEQHGNLVMARRWAKKAAALMPFSEEAQTNLIILSKRLGDRSEALRTYEAFAERLRTEWEMEPSDKLKALAEEINKQTAVECGQPTELSEKHTPAASANISTEAPHNRSQSYPESRLSAKEGASSYRWWVAAGGLLLIIILAGWMLWSGVSKSSSTKPAITERSVAVLPFTYLGAEDSTDYFSLGMTEEILSRLAQVSDLSVISRTSVMQYRDTEKSLRKIAGELGVATIVEGSVQQAGNRVRIHAQLINAKTDHHLWAASYNRKLEDIFAVQSDIAKAIAGELQAELASGVNERIERVPTKDLVAYELFLRGREYFQSRKKEENKTGINLLQRAIKRDPEFALARAVLAKAYAKDAWNHGADAQWADSAVTVAEQAVDLEPDLAEAHSALGFAHLSAGHFSEAGTSLRQTLELNPNHWGTVSALGIVYLQTGRLVQAIQLWKKSLKGNPAAAHTYRFDLALAYRILGLPDRAEQENRASLGLNPNFVGPIVNQAHVDLFRADTAAAMKTVDPLAREDELNPYALQSAGWIYIFAGEPELACDPLERAYALSPAASGEGYVRVLLGYVLWQAGERERAMKLFEEFERFAAGQLEKGNEYGMLPYSLAELHAVRGETEQALQWFERAVVEAGWPYELTAIHDPMLASLRDEERFKSLVDRMGERNEENRRRLEQVERQDLKGGLLQEGEDLR